MALGGVAFINLMYFLFLPLSFLIPSSSGLATVAMPIMAPLENARAAARRRPADQRLVDVVAPRWACVIDELALAGAGEGYGRSAWLSQS